jgi:hypothetical protein
MSRIKINTLQTKVEYIVLSLGGKPDSDGKCSPSTSSLLFLTDVSLVEENRRNLDEFEMAATNVKGLLNQCKERLKERTEKITLFGYQSKERIRK